MPHKNATNTAMLVQLNTNPAQIIDTTMMLPVPVLGSGPFAFPVATSQFGGTLVSGSFNYFNAAAGLSRMYWHGPNGSVTSWIMDDNTALQTLIDSIATAEDNGDAYLLVGTDGEPVVS